MELSEVDPPEFAKERRYDTLVLRFKDQSELLHRMTLIDLRIFSAYMAVQLALGAWITQYPPQSAGSPGLKPLLLLLGLLVSDGCIAFVAARLLWQSTRRRREAVATMQNVCAALGLYRRDFFATGITINAEPLRPEATATGLRQRRPPFLLPWGPWYIRGVTVTYAGVVLVAVGTLLR